MLCMLSSSGLPAMHGKPHSPAEVYAGLPAQRSPAGPCLAIQQIVPQALHCKPDCPEQMGRLTLQGHVCGSHAGCCARPSISMLQPCDVTRHQLPRVAHTGRGGAHSCRSCPKAGSDRLDRRWRCLLPESASAKLPLSPDSPWVGISKRPSSACQPGHAVNLAGRGAETMRMKLVTSRQDA